MTDLIPSLEGPFEEILIASPPSPCGVAWLLNFFLVLGIRVYSDREGIHKMWGFINKNQAILKPHEEKLKAWIPYLNKHNILTFRDRLSIRWSHELPDGMNINQKTILLTRDGRDVIYSQFKRERCVKTLNEMLQRRLPPLYLSLPHLWALHNYLWSGIIPREKLFHISFEQIKHDPFPVLKKLLDFVGIQRTDKEINTAITESSFEKAKEAEENYRKQATHPTPYLVVNRKGKPGEWKEIFTTQELSYYQGFPNEILEKNGYEVPEHNVNRPLADLQKIQWAQLALEEMHKKNIWCAIKKLKKAFSDSSYELIANKPIMQALLACMWLPIILRHSKPSSNYLVANLKLLLEITHKIHPVSSLSFSLGTLLTLQGNLLLARKAYLSGDILDYKKCIIQTFSQYLCDVRSHLEERGKKIMRLFIPSIFIEWLKRHKKTNHPILRNDVVTHYP